MGAGGHEAYTVFPLARAGEPGMRPVHTIRANLKGEGRISSDQQSQVALAGDGCELGRDN